MANILIVDDDRILVHALSCLVEARLPDALVETSTSAEESLQRVRDNDYDVIVSDIRMPQVDGMTLLAKVHEMRPDTPVILITGIGDYDVALRALRGGAFDFIPKPVDTDYFGAAIARATRVRNIARELEQRRTGLEQHARELASVVERQTQELREANRAKDEFLATVSHELRTPLTTVLGWSRLMLKGGMDPATMQQGIEAIERNATHQATLVEDLLDVCRIMTGKLRVAKQPVRFGHVVSEALETMTPLMQARNITASREIEANARVLGDPDRLHQVVSNLLSNAVKFTPMGGRIDVKLRVESGQVILSIRDTGVGIPIEFLPHVFDRFRQADSSVSRSRGGLGVGLAIVHHLVGAHGGTVIAESEGSGKGAAFIVRLPLLAGLDDAPVSSARLKEVDLDGVRLLVVDDDPDTLALFRHALELRGADVITAGSAASALEEMERELPDVLVCDIGMPYEDGYALIRWVRAKPTLRGVPAVAVTAFTRPEDVRHALAEGFDLHMPKPVEMDELAAKVSTLRRVASS